MTTETETIGFIVQKTVFRYQKSSTDNTELTIVEAATTFEMAAKAIKVE